MKNFLNYSEFLASDMYRSGSYYKNDLPDKEALYNEVLKFWPGAIMGAVYSIENGKQFFERFDIILDTINYITISKDHKGKYSISGLTYFGLPYVGLTSLNYYIRDNGITEPQNIGVLSTKKIEQWVNHYRGLRTAMIEKSKESVKKIDQFRASLEGLDVKYMDKENNSGYITKNGLEYSFTISKDSDYVEQRIKLNIPGKQNLNTFLQMSDNEYLPPVPVR